MATVEAKARRRAGAHQRLTASMEDLTERLGIDMPEIGQSVRDPELASIIELERQAGMLESVLESIPAAAKGKQGAKPKGDA